MVSIEQRMQIAAPIQRCFDLSCSIEVHLLGTERTGERAVDGVTTGLIGPGQFVRWQAKHLGVRQHLTSKITAFDSPRYFQDTMVEGAFKFMQHDHFFTAISESQTEKQARQSSEGLNAGFRIFSRPFGTARWCLPNPGLRPGLLSDVPTGLSAEFSRRL